MNIPENLKYSDTHEWIRVENSNAYIGITDYAQESLGDIVYVEMPESGEEFSKGDEVGTIESVKAASPIYTPVSGKVVQVNEDLEDKPELINQDPYKAYIFIIEISDSSEIDDLMSAADYNAFVEKEKESH
ncbi:MAG: glycine cleavage system protein GcvH [Spirochaetes bacterium]|nr:MAG: glycine cleavage system protein GcvH [Spirochaetota bacterium]